MNENFDPEYLKKVEHNIQKWGSYMFNVRDKYKPLSKEEIIADLKTSTLPCAVMMAQIEGDFNFSSVVRTANSFNLNKIFYFGRRKYDRRGCAGSYLYCDIQHLPSIEEIKNLKSQYRFVALENNIDRVPQNIISYQWQPNSLIVLGEEGNGIPKEVLDLCDDFVEIPSRGSIRSLNVAVAASISIYDYYQKSNIT